MTQIRYLFFLSLVLSVNQALSQSFNEDKTAMINFIKRMHAAAPFEGVKVLDDYDHQYFLSVLSLEKVKYKDPSTMNRVAQVKAQSQANVFFNGSTINSELVIKTTDKTEDSKTTSVVETIESIKENAMGFTQGLELLANYDNSDNTRVIFIFYRELK